MIRAYAYCLEWHLHASSAFDEMLLKPLAPWIEFERIGWDGKNHPAPADPTRLAVYCQYPPPQAAQAATGGVVWVPMWDWLAQSTFQMTSLPSQTRIVAYSLEVERHARAEGLNVHPVRFFLNPIRFPAADWAQPRTLLYWNRKGLLSTRALAALCQKMQVRRLLFRQKLDPVTPPGAALQLPARLGQTVVEHLATEMSHAEYLAQLARCNLFIAPRTQEGVGLTGLEALASGCCVLAYDQPALNEYIQHGHNGLLLGQTPQPSLSKRLRRAAQWRVAGLLAQRSSVYYHPVDSSTQWHGLEGYEPEALGHQARLDHETGRARWCANLESLAHFITAT